MPRQAKCFPHFSIFFLAARKFFPHRRETSRLCLADNSPAFPLERWSLGLSVQTHTLQLEPAAAFVGEKLRWRQTPDVLLSLGFKRTPPIQYSQDSSAVYLALTQSELAIYKGYREWEMGHVIFCSNRLTNSQRRRSCAFADLIYRIILCKGVCVGGCVGVFGCVCVRRRAAGFIYEPILTNWVLLESSLALLVPSSL